MAEEAQTRIQNALSKFVDEIDKSHLRGMQVIWFNHFLTYLIVGKLI